MVKDIMGFGIYVGSIIIVPRESNHTPYLKVGKVTGIVTKKGRFASDGERTSIKLVGAIKRWSNSWYLEKESVCSFPERCFVLDNPRNLSEELQTILDSIDMGFSEKKEIAP